jgi:hypothetical protein
LLIQSGAFYFQVSIPGFVNPAKAALADQVGGGVVGVFLVELHFEKFRPLRGQ